MGKGFDVYTVSDSSNTNLNNTRSTKLKQKRQKLSDRDSAPVGVVSSRKDAEHGLKVWSSQRATCLHKTESDETRVLECQISS